MVQPQTTRNTLLLLLLQRVLLNCCCLEEAHSWLDSRARVCIVMPSTLDGRQYPSVWVCWGASAERVTQDFSHCFVSQHVVHDTYTSIH